MGAPKNTFDWSTWTLSLEALNRFPEDLAKNHNAFPVGFSKSVLTLAVPESFSIEAVDTLEYLLNLKISTVHAYPKAIAHAIDRYYTQAQNNPAAFTIREPKEGFFSSDSAIESYVKNVIDEAIKLEASDIHWEPLSNNFRVRYRVQGRLQLAESPAKSFQPSLATYLKLLSNLTIDQKNEPQDGHLNWIADQISYDLRVSCIPSVNGESIVMRILDRENLNIDLDKLGLNSLHASSLRKLIRLQSGMILVTGPTGSGKTTTLYALLKARQGTEQKIVTVEDPIEYQLAGINQIPVESDLGMTFASALRSILRQSPNTIMVGEIRDYETADIAFKAANTGHLVFSSLHTNDVFSALARLRNLDLDPVLLADPLKAILSQRLIRTLCPHCKTPYSPPNYELELLDHPEDTTLYKPQGCNKCTHSGYLGRTAVFEILPISDSIREAITQKASLAELKSIAGPNLLRHDLKDKLISGQTSFTEFAAILSHFN